MKNRLSSTPGIWHENVPLPTFNPSLNKTASYRVHCAEHSPTKTDEGIRSCDDQRAMLRSNPAYFPLPVMLILLRSTCYVFFFCASRMFLLPVSPPECVFIREDSSQLKAKKQTHLSGSSRRSTLSFISSCPRTAHNGRTLNAAKFLRLTVSTLRLFREPGTQR